MLKKCQNLTPNTPFYAQVCSNFTKALSECYFVVSMLSPFVCIEEKPLSVCYRKPCSVTLPIILCNPRELCSGNVLEFSSIIMRFDSLSGYGFYWLFCGSGAWVMTLAAATLASNGTVIHELESFWKEDDWHNCGHLAICLEEMRKTTKNVS
jgi:hypothetical protein